jgi:hypothetical protein
MWGIFQRKFEWLFKYRDESNLNEPKAADGGRAASIASMLTESGFLHLASIW